MSKFDVILADYLKKKGLAPIRNIGTINCLTCFVESQQTGIRAMAEDGKVKIDKFDGHDFGFCRMQIEDYLYQKKLHEQLSGEKPEDMKKED
ncbi:hypothetical protein LXL04_007094 [Taraxacum kok-saghyz]